jgi:hypothetical protein
LTQAAADKYGHDLKPQDSGGELDEVSTVPAEVRGHRLPSSTLPRTRSARPWWQHRVLGVIAAVKVVSREAIEQAVPRAQSTEN